MQFRSVGKVALGLALVLAVAGQANAAGDPAAGEKAFKGKCGACHNATEAKNKVGPSLMGVYDRKAGMAADFKYSDAMKNSGITWDEAALDEYLKDPKGKVPGNKMAYPGLKDDTKRADVIAYLSQIGADGKLPQ